MDTLTTLFNDMKMVDIPSSSRNRARCIQQFSNVLSKWQQTHNGKYQYTIHAIKRAGQHDMVFRRQARLYRELYDCNRLTPQVFDVVTCGKYGLIITDAWDGNLAHLLRIRPEWRRNAHLIKTKLLALVLRLHNCGYTLGKCDLQTFAYKLRGGDLEIVIANTRRIRKIVSETLRQCDIDHINLLMIE